MSNVIALIRGDIEVDHCNFIGFGYDSYSTIYNKDQLLITQVQSAHVNRVLQTINISNPVLDSAFLFTEPYNFNPASNF